MADQLVTVIPEYYQALASDALYDVACLPACVGSILVNYNDVDKLIGLVDASGLINGTNFTSFEVAYPNENEKQHPKYQHGYLCIRLFSSELSYGEINSFCVGLRRFVKNYDLNLKFARLRSTFRDDFGPLVFTPPSSQNDDSANMYDDDSDCFF
jgi:hypothetical protein